VAPDLDGLLRAATAAGDRIALDPDGGQLLHWTCGGRERLFLSPAAVRGPGRSARGGVPVIFPQFGTFGPGPKHGFARHRRWTPVDPGREGALAAELVDDEATRAAWPHPCRLRLLAVAGPRSLSITLSVANTGPSPFDFAGGLHTYLAVSDVADVRLFGLEGRPYLDAAGGGRTNRTHGDEPLTFDGEVDRVYVGGDELLMSDRHAAVRIESRAFTETVVWNPGAALAASMPDLGAAYRDFVCVESAVVQTPVRLAPGEEWHGLQHLVITDR
jgi:glucose-6-phosphate 1-epimerase